MLLYTHEGDVVFDSLDGANNGNNSNNTFVSVANKLYSLNGYLAGGALPAPVKTFDASIAYLAQSHDECWVALQDSRLYCNQVLVTTFAPGIKQIAPVGDYQRPGCHLLALNGEVYSRGSNTQGELGTGNTAAVAAFTRNTLMPEKIAMIFACYEQSFFLGVSGKLYACGNNTNGALGLASRTVIKTPTEVPIADVSEVWVNGDFLYAKGVTIFKTPTGFYGCGDNTYGQLGLGHANPVAAPTRMAIPLDAKRVALASSYSFYLAPNGTAWYAGSQTVNGGLAGIVTSSVYKPFPVSGVQSMFVGRNRSIFLCGADVYSTGYQISDGLARSANFAFTNLS